MNSTDKPLNTEGSDRSPKGRGPFIIIVVVLLLIILAAVGLLILKKSQSEEQTPKGSSENTEETTYSVNTTRAVMGPIADYFRINGEVVSASSVEVYAEATGILSRLYVNLGDTVRKNQIIGEVDPSRAGMKYSLSPVKARAGGTVTSLPLSTGDVVSMQSPVAVIGNLQKLQVTAAIPERYVSRIRQGMAAEVTLTAWPGQSIPMKVTQINPVVDAASRTMEIRMDVPPNEPDIKPGMFAEIRLTTDEKDQVVKIPADSILRRLGETFVYVISDGRAEKRLVVPGITLEGVVEILEGLDDGEVIAWQGQTLLEDGVKVRVNREVQVIEP